MPSLEDNFVFYGSYHNNGVNQAAHVVCVPLIFITSLIMLAGIPICDCDCGIPCNAALLAAVAYGLFYISLRVGLGTVAAALVAGALYLANNIYQADPAGAWKPALAVHVACWLVQFYTHGVHEGRAPALLDNLFQSIFMAPFFVLIEVAIKLGFMRDFHSRVMPRIMQNIQTFKSQKATKSA